MPAFGKILAREFLDALVGFLTRSVRPIPNSMMPAVVGIVECSGTNARFIEHGPELIAAAGVIMAGADGGFAGVASHDHELHAFAGDSLEVSSIQRFTRSGEQFCRGAPMVAAFRAARASA